jgi:hypothetical protein
MYLYEEWTLLYWWHKTAINPNTCIHLSLYLLNLPGFEIGTVYSKFKILSQSLRYFHIKIQILSIAGNKEIDQTAYGCICRSS